MSERSPIVVADGQPHYEDINTPVILMLTVIAAVVTYALIAAIQGLYYQLKNAQIEAINARSVTMASEYMAKEKAELASGSDKKKIAPIAQSMETVVKQFGGEWPAASHDSPEVKPAPPAGEAVTAENH